MDSFLIVPISNCPGGDFGGPGGGFGGPGGGFSGNRNSGKPLLLLLLTKTTPRTTKPTPRTTATTAGTIRNEPGQLGMSTGGRREE